MKKFFSVILGLGSLGFGIVLIVVAMNTPVIAATAPLVGGGIFIFGGFKLLSS